MRNGLLSVALLVATAAAWAVEPAPAPRLVDGGPLVVKAYPVMDLIVPTPVPAAAPLGVPRPFDKAAAVVVPAPLPAALATAACPPPPAPLAVAQRDEAMRQHAKGCIKIVTDTVRRDSWKDAGGVGTVAFDAANGTLVVRQTEAAHREIADLLAALRKLTEVQVVLEMRIVELPEAFFEESGVGFGPKPCCEDGKTTSFVLSETQLAKLTAALRGNPRVDILSAPKLSCFDGQTGFFQVGSTEVFLSGLELSYTADKGFEKKEKHAAVELGMRVHTTPAVAKDRKSVELDLKYEFAATENRSPAIVLAGGTAMPEAALKKPSVQKFAMDTKVAIPTGRTAVLIGPAYGRETRTEYGLPVLSKVPYVNRLFKNTAICTESYRHVLLVTAKIVETPSECAECCQTKSTGEVAKLVAEYRAACAEGRTEDAMKCAMRALAKDPKCFAK